MSRDKRREREVEDRFDDMEQEHPAALSGIQRVGVVLRHTFGKMLKWGAIGAVAAAAFTVAAGVMLGWSGGWISVVGLALGKIWPAFGEKAIETATTTFLTVTGLGAAFGAVLAAVFGLSEGDSVAEAADAKRISKYERGAARRRQMEELALRREQQYEAMEQQRQGMGLSPGQLPHGRPPQGQRLNT